MELIKEIDYYIGTYTLIINDEAKELRLYYASNGDLYMSMNENRKLNKKYVDTIFMDINEEAGSIYNAVYNLYGRIIDKNKNNPRGLVDKENNIIWLDEDYSEDEADKFMIQKYGDIIRLKFSRINNPKLSFKLKRKDPRSINIRFRMNNSRYEEYAYEFDKFYKDLNHIETKVYKK